ncbi:MAG: CerR family C-terminal domain-containing protein [Sedimentisphaerales bacterium]|nr:CerR family C-terminal domain-containing protein [Sedimentisphaerales bacterium]
MAHNQKKPPSSASPPAATNHDSAAHRAHATRLRILETAERMFADRGYLHTSIRDISRLARCNLAAVNYHFGSKEKLYEQVFRQLLKHMRDQRIAAIQTAMGDDADRPRLENLLRRFAEVFLGQLDHDECNEHKLMKLLMREWTESCLPQDLFAREVVIPVKTELQRALQTVCPALSDDRAQLCIHSLIGQLTHAIQIRCILGSAGRHQVPIPDMPTLMEHIIVFTTAGIRHYLDVSSLPDGTKS